MAKSRYRNWLAYEKAFALSMELSRAAKSFPRAECYSLTDQLRRASRAVCANLAEAHAKSSYPKHWFSKLSDSAGENNETQTWIAFAESERYITPEQAQHFQSTSEEVSRLLNYMQRNREKFL